MGVCTNGYIQIVLNSVEDANKVFDAIENIEKWTVEKTKNSAFFNLLDNHVEDDIFHCNVYSNRVQNGEFQIEMVLERVKAMVVNGEIQPPDEFQGELNVQHCAWHLDEDNFNELKEE